MNNFVIGSAVTLIILVPVITFFAFANNGPQPVRNTSNAVSQLEEPGNLPTDIFTPSENCMEEITSNSVGAISSECRAFETLLDNEFMEQVRVASEKAQDLECAKNLPRDLSDLDKKIEGNKAKILIEGKKIVKGEDETAEEDPQDLQVEFIRTENDWEISDIRCLD